MGTLTSYRWILSLSVAALLAGTLPASAQTPVSLVIMDGDTPTGAPGAVTVLRNPHRNGLGHVGFLGTAGGTQFVWVNGAVVWLDTDDAINTLIVGDTDGMGLSDTGGWVYGPAMSGSLDDTIYSDSGLLLQETGGIAGMTGHIVINLYTPLMSDAGDIYFVASTNDAGGTTTTHRSLIKLPAGSLSTPQVVLQTGDMVGGLALDAGLGVDSDQYAISPDGNHYAAVVDLVSGSTTDDGGLVVDGTLIARELTSTGGADNWDNFDTMDITDQGNYLFSGDTDQSGGTADEFIAYNGVIILRELDTAGSITFDGSVDAVALNDLGQGAFIWDNGTTESLFFTCDLNAATTTTRVLLADNETIDIDGDGTADHTITDFWASGFGGPGLQLGEDGMLYLEVQLDGSDEAIIGVESTCCGDGVAAGSEVCDDGMETAACNVDCTLAVCGDAIVNTTFGEECDEGGTESVTCDTDCTFPVCGDGTANAARGETCDDAGESAACNVNCTVASCGDGIVNLTAGEECEDGNTADGDGCSSTCAFEPIVTVCGDGVTDQGEDCDDSGESATCNVDCTADACGDGRINGTAGEECEDGNLIDGDGCSASCLFEALVGNCGNGALDTGEDCDDSGESATCNLDCSMAACGDGMTNATAGEECEDGNTTGGDGCSPTCTFEALVGNCGNGAVDTGEDCDDSGESATCNLDCSAVACGDGMTNTTAGEECEDGNTTDGDGCSATCLFEALVASCGNSAVDVGETCDGGGESADCNANCTAVACGDGILNTTAGETCEDGNTTDGDGCSAACVIEPPPVAEEGCGCDQSESGEPWYALGLLLLMAGLRRRRF